MTRSLVGLSMQKNDSISENEQFVWKETESNIGLGYINITLHHITLILEYLCWTWMRMCEFCASQLAKISPACWSIHKKSSTKRNAIILLLSIIGLNAMIYFLIVHFCYAALIWFDSTIHCEDDFYCVVDKR